MFKDYVFEAIDWDEPDDEGGNLVHCVGHGVDEVVVHELLLERPVEVKLALQTAEFAIVGPDTGWGTLWTVLFSRSFKRGDWLRPVTGWRSKPAEVAAWEQATGREWKGRQ